MSHEQTDYEFHAEDEASFEPISKRRRGFPSETRVKRGPRAVKRGEVELLERLGNNDLCPCGSGRRFQELLSQQRPLLTAPDALTTTESAEPLSRGPDYRGSSPASVAQRKSTGLRTRRPEVRILSGAFSVADTVAEWLGTRLQSAITAVRFRPVS